MKLDNKFRYDIIFPARIVYTKGNITAPENLLEKKELQITTNENCCTILKNSLMQKNSEIILDFGKEINGTIRILTFTTNCNEPVRIQITYGESVSEAMTETGHKGSTNDHAIRDFEYILPCFSDMSFNETGFRFVRIKLLNKTASVSIKAVAAISKIRDIPYLGSFRCDNEMLNRIYDTAAYTCHLNMQQFIWDGIKRDRLVWVGDMHPEMLTVRTVFGNHPIIKDSLNFMRNQTPLPLWMNSMPTYSLWWLIILHDWYYYSGDNDFLDINKEYALSLIKIIVDLVNEDGSDLLPSYFLDWPCNDKPQSISGSRALLCYALEKAASLAAILNEDTLADACRLKANILKSTKINSYGAKQVTAIASLTGWANKNEAAEEILRDSSSGWSTFMSYYLLKAASCCNMEAALKALEEYYGGMLLMGATTFWEDFDIDWLNNASPIDEIPKKDKSDIHADNGRFCYKGLRHSLCHGWASGPAAFLAEEVLGVKIEAPGCTRLRISPNLGNLEFARGTYPTPLGVISIECKKSDNRTLVSYTAPDGIEIVTD